MVIREMQARAAQHDGQYQELCMRLDQRLQQTGESLETWGRNIAGEFANHKN